MRKGNSRELRLDFLVPENVRSPYAPAPPRRPSFTGFDRDRKTVRTAQGNADDDYLILAGDIRNACDICDAWFGNHRKVST